MLCDQSSFTNEDRKTCIQTCNESVKCISSESTRMLAWHTHLECDQWVVCGDSPQQAVFKITGISQTLEVVLPHARVTRAAGSAEQHVD